MQFMEVIESLMEGKFAQRSVWTDGSYVCLMPGVQMVWKMTFKDGNSGHNIGPFGWLVEDFLATDWEIYEGNNVRKPVTE